ncbi:MAG: hypothetical protein M4D80_33275 [Myxococcota bacterium]|nr:hypothetical protein [Deltaproteobacteria bacterium]MDQ3340057.1 hypothetical protein [Myxococcota bacterium]
MGVDRRTFLTLVGAAPAVTLASCQRVDNAPKKPLPPLQALRDATLEDIEPAIVFAPLRRNT